MPYFFVPPHVTRRVVLDGPLTYPTDYGLTVMVTGGVATQKQYATAEERAAADFCYIGGTMTELSAEEVDMLIGLGYSDNVFFLGDSAGNVTFESLVEAAVAAGGAGVFTVSAGLATTVGLATAAGGVTSFGQAGFFTYDPDVSYAGALATAGGGATSFLGPSGAGTFTTTAASGVAVGGLSSMTGAAAPAAISSDTSGATTASTVDLAVPSTAAVGDTGLICATFNQTAVPTDPAGWTLIQTLQVSTSQVMRLWYRDFDGTEAGTTISWSPVGSSRFVAQLVVLSSAGAVDVAATWSSTTAGTGYTIPSLTPTQSDTLHIAFESAKLLSAGPFTSSPPTGWTELDDVSSPSTGSPSLQQSVLQSDTTPTSGVATGNTTGGVTSTSVASRGVIALAVTRDTTTPPATRQMYYGAFAYGGTPDPFENGTGTFAGKGIGGRILPAFRKYYAASASDSSIASRVATDHAAGRLPMISSKVPSDWTTMASGSQDAWLQGRINACIASKEVILMLHHEPWNDINGTTNTAASWIAMHAHAKALKDATAGASNVKITGMLNGFNLEATGSERDGFQSAPADGAFDYYGADRYQPWQTGDPAGSWASASEWGTCITVLKGWGWENKIVIGEWATADYTAEPGRSAQWILDAYEFAYANGVYAISHFNSDTGLGTMLSGSMLTSFITCLDDPRTARI